MQSRRIVTNLVILGLLIISALSFVVPVSAHGDETIVLDTPMGGIYPGLEGTPTNVTLVDDVYFTPYEEPNFSPHPPYGGIVSHTIYPNEIKLDGPNLALGASSDYVQDMDIALYAVETYVPIGFLDKEPWYNHRLEFSTTEESGFSFGIKAELSLPLPVEPFGEGYYSTNEYTTTSFDSGYHVHSEADYSVLYVKVKFLHAEGWVKYQNDEVIQYDDIVIAKTYPKTMLLLPNADILPSQYEPQFMGVPGDWDFIQSLQEGIGVSYSNTNTTAWGTEFGLKFAPSIGAGDDKIKLFDFKLSISLDWEESSSTYFKHSFITNLEDTDPFCDGGGLPKSVTGFYIEKTSFGLVNLHMDHLKQYSPIEPSISKADIIDVGSSYDYTVSSSSPVNHSLRYILFWGDGTSTTTDYIPSGEEVTIPHVYKETGNHDLRVVAETFYGDRNESIMPIDVLDLIPEVPAPPEGPSVGYLDQGVGFSFNTTDDHDYNVRYQIDWGDGQSTVTGFHEARTYVYETHVWEEVSTGLDPSYTVRVRAQNDHNDTWTEWSEGTEISITTSTPNSPVIGYPSSVPVGVSGTYTARAIDDSGGVLQYKFYWDDGTTWTSPWTESNVEVSKTHVFTTGGSHIFNVEVKNQYGNTADSELVFVSVTNTAPSTPAKPYGPTSGYVDTAYSFKVRATDPDGHSVRYQISWGDGRTTTTGYYASGANVYVSHKWTITMSGGIPYQVKVRAQDAYGAWSGWSSVAIIVINPAPGGGGGPILLGYTPPDGLSGYSTGLSLSAMDECPIVLSNRN